MPSNVISFVGGALASEVVQRIRKHIRKGCNKRSSSSTVVNNQRPVTTVHGTLVTGTRIEARAGTLLQVKNEVWIRLHLSLPAHILIMRTSSMHKGSTKPTLRMNVLHSVLEIV